MTSGRTVPNRTRRADRPVAVARNAGPCGRRGTGADRFPSPVPGQALRSGTGAPDSVNDKE